MYILNELPLVKPFPQKFPQLGGVRKPFKSLNSGGGVDRSFEMQHKCMIEGMTIWCRMKQASWPILKLYLFIESPKLNKNKKLIKVFIKLNKKP